MIAHCYFIQAGLCDLLLTVTADCSPPRMLFLCDSVLGQDQYKGQIICHFFLLVFTLEYLSALFLYILITILGALVICLLVLGRSSPSCNVTSTDELQFVSREKEAVHSSFLCLF